MCTDTHRGGGGKDRQGKGAGEREGGFSHNQRIACMAQWRHLIAPSFSKTSTQLVSRLIPQG